MTDHLTKLPFHELVEQSARAIDPELSFMLSTGEGSAKSMVLRVFSVAEAQGWFSSDERIKQSQCEHVDELHCDSYARETCACNCTVCGGEPAPVQAQPQDDLITVEVRCEGGTGTGCYARFLERVKPGDPVPTRCNVHRQPTQQAKSRVTDSDEWQAAVDNVARLICDTEEVSLRNEYDSLPESDKQDYRSAAYALMSGTK